MKKFAITLMLAVILVVSFGSGAMAAKGVYVDKYLGTDAWTLDHGRPILMAALAERGCQVVSDKSQADVILTVTVIKAEISRSFNFWILLFPLWPIVPLTTASGEIIISMQAVDQSGNVVWMGQGGGSDRGPFFFGDFAGKEKMFETALRDATRTALASFS